MTVEELIELLLDVDPESEVRLATQPAWPFENRLDNVVDVPFSETDGVVYLVEGDQIGYLQDKARTSIGW